MQLNSGTNAIIADIDFHCDTNSTSYPLEAKIRNINRWAYAAHVAQIEASHRWQIDDTNLTTLPHLTTTLVDSQKDYTLPSGYLRVERVEIKDSEGDYHVLKPIDQRDIKGGYKDFKEDDGVPQYFDLVGNSLLLFPAPSSNDVTTTEGLRVHILREIDLFTTADTTQEPGFPEPFHRVVVYGACYDYMLGRKDYEAAQSYRNEVDVMIKKMKQFTAQMNNTEHTRIRPGHRTSNYL